MATAPLSSSNTRENLLASKANKQNEVKSFIPKLRAEEDQVPARPHQPGPPRRRGGLRYARVLRLDAGG